MSGEQSWFLTGAERGNRHTTIDARHPSPWTTGNRCRPLVHGRTYYARLLEELRGLGTGDLVCFTDWRGDADERLAGPGTEVGSVLTGLAARGVLVRGLLWRSHPSQARFSEQQNLHLGVQVNEAGGEIVVDERVRRGGSHHQKLVVIRRQPNVRGAGAGGDVAFVGGIDLAHGRHDDADHHGDPQAIALDPRYGPMPAWHDLQVEVHGPAVGDLEHTFRERWDDPVPVARGPWSRLLARAAHEQRQPSPLPAQADDPPAAGGHAVQVLRTYPARRPGYRFAPKGERSIARAYIKAFARARRLIYIEDQYLWCTSAADLLADALRANPGLHLIVVVPRFPDEDGRLSGPANRISQLRVLRRLAAAGGERFAAYDLERTDGRPIYVHAKVCIIDDVWMMSGSDNVNRRSWTHDSEVSIAIVDSERDNRDPLDPAGLGDGARVLARTTRLDLWREHLEDDVAVDPVTGVQALAGSAARLDAWHDAGGRGPRPPGRLRVHRPEPVAWWAQPLAEAFYRVVSDPDGRPLARRLRRTY
ncbi:MAG: phosphatidylserine/phosphatidylglycerophosphate/cardiolipinsynthase-like protein [Ilumatobacteraceae bacterium]|nr:phosphatidylserine/phosphatidylglycerophosphate/cardiolipinsynthase-like protein [Ilumatobacteraceae bacterium]